MHASSRYCKKKYPAAGLWSHSWPLPLSQLASSSNTAQEVLDDIVESIVRETFDADYEKFRSVEWGKKHKISKEHREQIVVDEKEVKESAEAAKVEVNKAVKRFITAVQRKEIGLQSSSSSKSVPRPPIEAATSGEEEGSEEAPTSAQAATAAVEEEAEEDIDAGLEEEMWGKDGDPSESVLDWRELLDFMQASAGESKSAQWRNWHLLNAVKRTRQRCEKLFPHQSG